MLIKFLKERFESGIQMFDTPSLANDYRIPIYVEDDITRTICTRLGLHRDIWYF